MRVALYFCNVGSCRQNMGLPNFILNFHSDNAVQSVGKFGELLGGYRTEILAENLVFILDRRRFVISF